MCILVSVLQESTYWVSSELESSVSTFYGQRSALLNNGLLPKGQNLLKREQVQ